MAMRTDWNLVKRFVWHGVLGLRGLFLPGALTVAVTVGLWIALALVSWPLSSVMQMVTYNEFAYYFLFYVAF
jgi:hypothetical protein